MREPNRSSSNASVGSVVGAGPPISRTVRRERSVFGSEITSLPPTRPSVPRMAKQAGVQVEASLPPLAFAYDEAPETRRNPRSDDSLDDNCDDSCYPSDAAYTIICGRSCLVTASARSWQFGGLRRPEVQDHLAAGQRESWLVWEQIWERNTAKPLQINGMRCN